MVRIYLHHLYLYLSYLLAFALNNRTSLARIYGTDSLIMLLLYLLYGRGAVITFQQFRQFLRMFGFSENTASFLSKHSDPTASKHGYRVYFTRLARGVYRIN